jgi:DNA-binding transcriptional regulator YiaG
MIHFAVVFKEEVCRLARKVVRTETSKMKQAVVQYRRDIARLKRQVHTQQQKLTMLDMRQREGLGRAAPTAEPAERVRFSARSVRAQRKRLKLSAEDYAKLAGVSTLTVYNWEHGKTRPRKSQLAALIALRRLGRRDALAKLEHPEGDEKSSPADARREEP